MGKSSLLLYLLMSGFFSGLCNPERSDTGDVHKLDDIPEKSTVKDAAVVECVKASALKWKFSGNGYDFVTLTYKLKIH